jgi:hypothetical protein
MLDDAVGCETRLARKGFLGLMRNGRREVLILAAVFLLGTTPRFALAQIRMPGAASEELVGITVEVRWSTFGGQGRDEAAQRGGVVRSGLTLESTEGQVTDVVAWPPETEHGDAFKPHRGADGIWQLGPGASGRVRARLEVTPGAELVLRHGDGIVRIPVAAVRDRPQQTPSQSPLSVSVERLPWDSLMVNLGPGEESGVVAPGRAVPVWIKYNILWPEATDVNVRTTAVIRPMNGGEALWRDEQRETVPANRLDPPGRIWNVPAPTEEGTYVLELHATWEPAGVRESSRLGRLIRRRKPAPVATTASRRLVLAVVSPKDQAGPRGQASATFDGSGREAEVDTVDLGRIRNTRFASWGRSPVSKTSRTTWYLPGEMLLDANRRDRDRERLRGWIPRAVAEAASLGPANDTGLAWSAVGLRATHPDRPHRLYVTVTGGDPSALGIAVVDPGGSAREPRVLLDACASGPPVLKEGPPVTFSWLVWPDTPEPLLVVLNRNASGSVRLGPVKLAELESLPPPLPVRVPNTPPARTLGLYLTGDHALDRFGGKGETGLADSLEVARNLVSYLSVCGASLAVLPERLTERQARRALQGQAEEDATGPDQLDMVLRLLRRNGYSAWLELNLEGMDALPGLPPPDSPEALQQGIVRVDRQGLADGPAYHPLHPEVRQAMKRRVEQALARRDDGASFAGLLLQLGPGPTLLGSPDTGMDDDTFARFVHDTFGPETAEGIPGLGSSDPARFAARSKYLSGVGRMPWLTWRSRAIAALYSELAEAARTASPGAVLALATPALHGGAAGVEARRVDLAGLAPSQAWRSVGLDLQAWPSGAGAPILLRGAELSTDPLAHDLATSPDLDTKLLGHPERGLFLKIDPDLADSGGSLGTRSDGPAGAGDPSPVSDLAGTGRRTVGGDSNRTRQERSIGSVALSTLPLGDGSIADEPLGHALAALDAHWVILAAPAVAGHEERLRGFATVLRSLPASPAQPVGVGDDQKDYGVAVRTLSDPTQTFLEIANDTPYAIRLAGILDAPAWASVEDLGRNLRLVPQAVPGGRQLVIDLLPFGVSAIRVGAPKIQMTEITPYPSEAVLTSMEAQYRELSTQLARLNHGPGSGIGEPPNPGFEPDVSAPEQPQDIAAGGTPPAQGGQVKGGWKVEGPMGCLIAIDASNPHSGQGSLKLTAPAAPVSVTSGDFVPTSASSMTIQAYLRAEPADSTVRLWIQGEVGGQPYLRRTEFKVASSWELKRVRATDLPAGGLDSARLRFEMMSPGTLWIDDIHLIGGAAPKAVRRNTERTLLAALQAYRAQHYAEFARLSSSHWARHPGVFVSSRLNHPFDLSETSGSARPGSAAASALSPGRTLR